MTTEAIVLLLGGIGTFIGAVVGAVRLLTGDRFNRKVTESANLLSGYTEQVKTLRQDMDTMRTQHQQDLTNLRAAHAQELAQQAKLHAAERARWVEERNRMEERIDELEAKVTALMFRPPGTKQRKTD